MAANQVIEHLGFGEALRVTSQLARHVAPGGIFEIGVPNPPHPTRFLGNPTHQTPWNFLNLCAFGAGRPGTGVLCPRNKVPGPRWWERPLVNLMCRVFRMDWCDSVFAIGRRRT